MSNNNKIQTGINNISNEWFRANIDRKTLKIYANLVKYVKHDLKEKSVGS